MSEHRKAYGILKLRETWVVAEATHRTMVGNTATETKPEKAFRKALWAAGLRGYRKNVRKLPGKPDVVYNRAKLALFVHGCYWHQCPYCQRNRTPKTNAQYWEAKFKQNTERDEKNQAALRALGYTVVVIWECQLRKNGLYEQVEMVRQLLQGNPNG